MEAISKARKSVHFESFLWKQGKLGKELVDALCERARAGVSVRVLVDAKGCDSMGDDACPKLVAAGAKFGRFHPLKLHYIGVFNQRDHRKILLIDGKTAFVGGHCIVDGVRTNRRQGPYRDLSVGSRPRRHRFAVSAKWVRDRRALRGRGLLPKFEAAGSSRSMARYSPRLCPRR